MQFGSGERSGFYDTNGYRQQQPPRRPLPTSNPNVNTLGVAPSTAAVAGNTNQETRDALEYASRIVDETVDREMKSDDLYDLLISAQLFTQQSRDEISTFQRKRFAVLPQALFEQYSHLEYKCFMGIFPEINRAWVTIDNKFFTWCYHNGTDFNEYDELDQVIVSAGLIRPRDGVFKDYVKYLLVLATPVEIVLVGVSFNNANDMSEMSLLPTSYSVPSDNVNMLKIAGTSNGRIFMCGQDGCLYELLYEADDGWFQKKCRKVNHTQSKIAVLVPNFLKFTNEDPLLDIAIDNNRNILYTLSEKSHIEVYDLGVDGKGLTKVVTYRTLDHDARCKPSGPVIDHQDAIKLVSISVIDRSVSLFAHLVAVSTKGTRYYFSTFQRAAINIDQNPRPQHLELFHIRPRPISNQDQDGFAFSAPLLRSDTTFIHDAFYNNGVFILADTKSDDVDSLICLSLETDKSQDQIQQQLVNSRFVYPRTFMSESVSSIEVDGKTLAIAEVPISTTYPAGHDIIRKAGYNVQQELSTQLVLPPREFVCLSNNGIYLLVKLRPIDKLQQILQTGVQSEALHNFINRYGADEACAMFLQLACSPNPSLSANAGAVRSTLKYSLSNEPITDSQILRAAEALFFHWAGEPRLSEYARDPRNQAPMYGPNVIFSNGHNALYLYLSRLVRPLWSTPFISFTFDQAARAMRVLTTNIHVEHLNNMETALLGLKGFLDKYPNLFSPGVARPRNILKRVYGEWGKDNMMHGGIVHQTYSEEPQRAQQRSLYGLYQIVSRCLQALTFLDILNSFDISSITQPLMEEFRGQSDITFRDFILLPSSQKMMQKLVRLLISQDYMREGSKVDMLCELLRQKCSDFFSQVDLNEYKAFDLLERAKALRPTSEAEATARQALINESLRIYMMIAGSIHIPTVCKEFQSLRAYTGAVDLAIAGAEQADPNGLGIEYYRAGQPATDYQGKQCFERRNECYKAIISVLGELSNPAAIVSPPLRSSQSGSDSPYIAITSPEQVKAIKSQILNKIYASDDELLHHCLYKWQLQHGNEREILDTQFNRYIESFLSAQNPELLWQYYEKQEKYDKSAQVLSRLAEQTKEGLNLKRRLEYLSKAVVHAKAVSGMGELLHQLQEKLDVAKVQMKVYQELEATRPTVPEDVEDPQQYLQQEEEARQAALAELNSTLFNITELYNKFAQRFKLWESALAILQCAGYEDTALIQRLWINIIEKVLATSPNTFIQKLQALGKEYYVSEKFFPLAFLCTVLENRFFSNDFFGFSETRVARMFRDIGVPFHSLYAAYSEVYQELFEEGKPISPLAPPTQYHDISGAIITASDDFKLHIITVMCFILAEWVRYVLSPAASQVDKDSFPVARVELEISKLGSELNKFNQSKARRATEFLDTARSVLQHQKPLLLLK